MCLTLDSCFASRQIDDRDVVTTRGVAGQGGTAPSLRIVGMSTNADDVELTAGGWIALAKTGAQWAGHGKKSFSTGDLVIGHGSPYRTLGNILQFCSFDRGTGNGPPFESGQQNLRLLRDSPPRGIVVRVAP